MRLTGRFLTIALAASAFYFILYLFLKDFFLYVIGGALGSLVRLFNTETNVILLTFLWVVALTVVTLFYYRLNRKPIKYLFLLLVSILLYVVDFILYFKMNFDSFDRIIIYSNATAMILIKSLVFSLIIHLGDNKVIKDVKNDYF